RPEVLVAGGDGENANGLEISERVEPGASSASITAQPWAVRDLEVRRVSLEKREAGRCEQAANRHVLGSAHNGLEAGFAHEDRQLEMAVLVREPETRREIGPCVFGCTEHARGWQDYRIGVLEPDGELRATRQRERSTH